VNRSISIVVFIVSLFVLISCVTNPGDHEKTIFGYWQFVKSTGGFAGETTTPDELGYQEILHFSQDSLVFRYRDNQLITVTQYHIYPGQNDGVADTLYRKDHYVRQIISFNTADTLVLTDYCIDCYQTVFSRTQPIK